jgi:NarL family two-component system response regulator LiaR
VASYFSLIMTRIILLCALLIVLGALALAAMRYHLLLIGGRSDLYAAGVAVLFLAVGLWAGRTYMAERERAEVQESFPDAAFAPASTEASIHDLTQREVEVLVLMAAGKTNKEIADTLFVSANTVKTHASNIFSKLGVSRRVQAIQRGIDAGIITRMDETTAEMGNITRSGDAFLG